MARETQVAQALVSLAEAMVSGVDVIDVLHQLCREAVAVLDVTAAGVMLADENSELRAVAASDERTHLLEIFAVQHDEGPCLDAFRTGHVEQLTADEASSRWPRFGKLAEVQGYRRFCGIPLTWGGDRIGALNLFRASVAPLPPADVAIARALANMASIAVLQHRESAGARRLTTQLQTALHSRVLIEQAKGTLAERMGVSVEEAFERMRAQARDANRKLHDVAYDIVHGRSEATGEQYFDSR